MNQPMTVAVRQAAHWRQSTLLNLSDGGLRLVGRNELSSARPVTVALDLDGEPLTMTANAVWQVEMGELRVVGLQFLPGQADQEDSLRVWIGRHLLGA